MRKQLSILTLTAITTLFIHPPIAEAHHRSGHTGGPSHRQPEQEASEATTVSNELVSALTGSQRAYITEILRDVNHPDAALIDIATRREIQAQVSALPPGIQRRLARGRSLPPGIAKKVLSNQINDRIGLEENAQIIVVGPDVAVVDPVTGVIIDIIREILL